MKPLLSFILASAVFILGGCNTSTVSTNKIQSPKVMGEEQKPVFSNKPPPPANSYKVQGEVRKPGWILCSGEPEKLQELIEKCGGVTEEAYIKKIRVIHSNVTNIYNLWHIRAQKAEDPIVPCGATIIVRKLIK